VQKLGIFHQSLYILSSKLSKRDRFGIHLKIENLCLDCLRTAIAATFEEKTEKIKTLKTLRVNVEILKRLIRDEMELKIIDNRCYWRLQNQLEEISKMTSGWIKYLQPPLT
jgi:hypothetical protein